MNCGQGDGAHRQEPFYYSERLRFLDQITLAAVRSAVGCSRAFLKLTFTKWRATSMEDDALVIVSELVTNAVKVTGVLDDQPTWAELEHLDLIGVRLLGLQNSIVIEVWDTSRTVPILPTEDPDAEGGRGLHLVQGLSKRWGSHPTSWGKVVWAEVIVPHQDSPALPRRRRTTPPDTPPASTADPELLRQVLTGLRVL